jgi:hypothetical protein
MTKLLAKKNKCHSLTYSQGGGRDEKRIERERERERDVKHRKSPIESRTIICFK